ncbi:MAG: FkbM family methyltransferase [Sulfuricaulis sp.]|uniref:FkbM family methyltransferase n=1 Tax=Sulfuricaulis sp. TaxID=2003553 RepID=UPI0025F252AA|nr:FkbM family methyltransferase [Sulfuricaulis sp.]MCR4347320.1 FkbM family methyltransferase [Sulfuricaulis sp.]
MLNRIVRSLINSLGYDFHKIKKQEPKHPFSVLKYIIFERMQNNPDFYFVQIGANDGLANDPIRPLVKQFHMKGLLVEPMPDFFAKLTKNYADEPQLGFENCAIGARDGEVSLFRFKPDAPLPNNFFHGMARFDKSYMFARARSMGLNDAIEEIKVPALTFQTLVRKHNIRKIDFLQIDTEGFDFEIIKMAFSLSVLPEIINYEWTELSAEDRYACKTLLVEKGYSFVDIGPDVLCVLNP